ncbi:glycine-rich protein [uncultured Shewanella sp.]|uniref:glycine-rich protein n=1 Tax=uncultured Shewanella sp. TaxID=173975 RepID=UPI0026268B7A|nr:glycine-rich protein [uncultured Shewanella sp.]
MIKLITACCALFAISTSLKANEVKLLVDDELTLYSQEKTVDYYVPESTTAKGLTVTLRGGDGGYRYGVNFGIKSKFGKGGGGATIETHFFIGNQDNEINPGSVLRLVAAAAGSSRAYTLGTACGGAGGGSALLMKRHVADPDWIILAVAGGGGGATGGPSNKSSNHGGNGVAWEASCKFGVCEQRVCRVDLSHRDGSSIPIYGEHGGSVEGFLGGYPAGSQGQKDGNRIQGGFGFGGGGAVTGLNCHSGGGGGYCGGLSGRENNGSGKGGSSYINPDFVTINTVRKDGSQDHTTTQGHVSVLLNTKFNDYTHEHFPLHIQSANIETANDFITLDQGHLSVLIGPNEEGNGDIDILKEAHLTNLNYLLLDHENDIMMLYHSEEQYPEQINEYREIISQCAEKVEIADIALTTNAAEEIVTSNNPVVRYQAKGELIMENRSDVEQNNATPIISCTPAFGSLIVTNFNKIDYDPLEKRLHFQGFNLFNGNIQNSYLKVGAYN